MRQNEKIFVVNRLQYPLSGKYICHVNLFLYMHLQWQHEDVLSTNNQPLSVSIPPRSVILSNMKKKLYKLSQDEAAIVAIQVSNTPLLS